MDPRLIAAAQNGDVNQLHDLMAGNPFLFIPAEFTGGENPLHIACMAGHLDFVKEILFYNPEFAEELNTVGMSPLHIASAYGYLDIVKELLKVEPHLCLVRAKNSKTALHYAVVREQIQIMEELISASLDSITQVTNERETCFHIAVKHNQVEALQLLKHATDSSFFLRGMFDLETHFRKLNVSSETRDAMLVVTVLIAAATFQVIVNPPGGVWQDTVVLGNNTAYDHDRSKVASTSLPHVAGTSIFATLSPGVFILFLVINSFAFMTSCLLSFVLMKPPYQMVIWLALVPMMGTYSISVGVLVGKISISAILTATISGVPILSVIVITFPMYRIYLYYKMNTILALTKTCIKRS